MLINKQSLQKGDTLIEVLFAVTVFSLVAVGSISIMNQGTSIAQRSLEITLVSQEIDAQAETLRFVHDSYIAAYPDVVAGEPSSRWSDIVSKSDGVVSASTFGSCTPPSGAFILNTKTAKLEAAKITSVVPTYSQLRYTPEGLAAAEGIWIEAVRATAISGSNSSSIDFHIRACWNSVGQAAPMTLGTIVRLYEPL